jgi:hypothetical protein
MRPRGATLIETLVTGALLLIALAIMVGILIPTLRAWLRSDERSQVQQNALMVLVRLREEVRGTAPSSLFLPSQGGITLASFGPKPQYQSGDLVWQKHVVLYRDAVSREVRSQETLFSPTNNPLKTYTPRPDDRVVARNIKALSFELTAQNGVKVHIESELKGHVAVLDSVLSPVLK